MYSLMFIARWAVSCPPTPHLSPTPSPSPSSPHNPPTDHFHFAGHSNILKNVGMFTKAADNVSYASGEFIEEGQDHAGLLGDGMPHLAPLIAFEQ
jgi:hypothetical protein